MDHIGLLKVVLEHLSELQILCAFEKKLFFLVRFSFYFLVEFVQDHLDFLGALFEPILLLKLAAFIHEFLVSDKLLL